MRRKKTRPARGAGRSQSQVAPVPTRADSSEVTADRCNVNDTGSERLLIDRFGHLHARSVLRDWPDKVREIMGLRFIDKSELAEVTNGRSR